MPIHGIYRAKVEETIDPLGNGRFAVRLRQPPSTETARLLWVTYTSPMGGISTGQGAGFFMPPRKGAIVEIAFENGDPQSPIYLCTVFSPDRQTNQNVAPIEAADNSQDPINRILKTDRGHMLELDDRDQTASGAPTSGIRIRTAEGKEFELGDGTKRVRLTSGSLGHFLQMDTSTLQLSSRAGRGVFVNDDDVRGAGLLLRGGGEDDVGLSLVPRAASLEVADNIKFKTDNVVTEAKSIQTETMNCRLIASSSVDITSGGSITQSALSKWNLTTVNGVDVLMTGGSATNPSNFIVRSPVPGIPQLSGHVHYDMGPLSNFTFRVGAQIPGPTPPGFMPSTPDLGDILATSRICLGGALGGAAVMEGLFGGLYISDVPIPTPGTNVIPPVKTPGPYIPVPGLHEPLVKGQTFLIWLNALAGWMSSFLTGLSTLAAAPGGWGLAGGFMPVSAPGVTAFIAAQQAVWESTIKPPLLAPHPLGFLSQIAFTQ